MSRTRVRAHTRRVEGETIKVRRHYRDLNHLMPQRRGRSMVKAHRGTRNVRKALAYASANRKAAATVFAVAGLTEIGAWLGLRGVSVLAASLAIVAAALAALAFMASRAEHPAGPRPAAQSRQVATPTATRSRRSAAQPAGATRSPAGRRRSEGGRR